jgi:hypothetical protein
MADRGHKFQGCPQEKGKTPHPPISKRRTKTRRKHKTRCSSDSSHLRGSDVENGGNGPPKTLKTSRNQRRRGSVTTATTRPTCTSSITYLGTLKPVSSVGLCLLDGKAEWPVEAWVTPAPPQNGRSGSSLSGVRLPCLGSSYSDQNGSGSHRQATGNGGSTDSAQAKMKKKPSLLVAIKPYNQEAVHPMPDIWIR